MNTKREDLSPRETLFANAPLHPYVMGFAALADLQGFYKQGSSFPLLSFHPFARLTSDRLVQIWNIRYNFKQDSSRYRKNDNDA